MCLTTSSIRFRSRKGGPRQEAVRGARTSNDVRNLRGRIVQHYQDSHSANISGTPARAFLQNHGENLPTGLLDIYQAEIRVEIGTPNCCNTNTIILAIRTPPTCTNRKYYPIFL